MNKEASEPNIRPIIGPSEFPQLVEIWRTAVWATHDFLEESDFERIECALVPDYFPAVELTVAERDGQMLGFAGIAEGNLEMLFVLNEAPVGGLGSALLADAITNHGVTKVDVNEQNAGAHGFYLSRGFREVGRSPVDGDGRPYPLLHLQLSA